MQVEKSNLDALNNRLSELIKQGNGHKLEARNIRMFFMMQIPGWDKIIFKQEREAELEADIKITRWQDGNHFYAKYKGIDVVVDGEQKWSTYRQAYEKAIEYANAQST